jgi:hypothetical protein
MAKAQRMPVAGSASAFMMRALPSVLPQPVEAMLTMKAPWLAAAGAHAGGQVGGLVLPGKRASALRF